MSKRVLISGGTGYVGSKMVAALSGSGYEVVVLTRRSSSSAPPEARYVVHDLTWPSVVAALEESQAETVIHAAAKYVRQHRAADVAPMIEANVTLGALLLEAAATVGVTRFLYTGSFFQHSGASPGTPRNLYAALKNAFEDVLDYYGSTMPIDSVSLTLCDVYGEDDPRPRVLNAAVAAAIHGSVLVVPMHDPYLVPIHVDDVTEAVRVALESSFAKDTFWIGPDAGVRLSDVLSTVMRLTGKTIRIEQANLPALPGDTVAPPRGTPLPGWTPSVSLEEGIRRMIFRANGQAKR